MVQKVEHSLRNDIIFAALLQKRMKKQSTKAVDTIGMITSGLCAVHCAALPVLFSLGILGGASSAAHHSLELAVLVVSVGVGAWSIMQAMKTHGKIFPQLIIVAGLSLIVTGFLLATAENHSIMAIGGLILVSGHWINRRYLLNR